MCRPSCSRTASNLGSDEQGVHAAAITASEARKHLFPLIEQVNDDHTPVEITSKRGRHALSGSWARRITEEHHLVHLVNGDDLVILQGRLRYEQPLAFVAVSVSAAHADAFYVEALATGAVWALRDADGFPAPANVDGQRAMPFWSKKRRAEVVTATVEAYRGFEVVQIPLDEWRGRWLPGLARDGLFVGLNWSGPRATGYDVAPGDVGASLTARAQGRLPRQD